MRPTLKSIPLFFFIILAFVVLTVPITGGESRYLTVFFTDLVGRQVHRRFGDGLLGRSLSLTTRGSRRQTLTVVRSRYDDAGPMTIDRMEPQPQTTARKGAGKKEQRRGW